MALATLRASTDGSSGFLDLIGIAHIVRIDANDFRLGRVNFQRPAAEFVPRRMFRFSADEARERKLAGWLASRERLDPARERPKDFPAKAVKNLLNLFQACGTLLGMKNTCASGAINNTLAKF